MSYAAPTQNSLTGIPMVDTYLSGFSVISMFFSQYLHMDISAYISLVFLLATVVATVRLRVETVMEKFRGYFTSTIEVRMDDEVFSYLMFWISRQRFSQKSTRVVASTRTNSGYYYYSDDSDEDSDDSDDDEGDMVSASNDFDSYWEKRVGKDKLKPLRITPAEGTHNFRFRNYRITFRREREEKRQFGWGSPPEKLYISCFGRNPDILKDLLLEAQKMYVDRDGDRTIIYRGQRNSDACFDWTRCMARSPRPLSTVVLDEGQKSAFISDIKEYLHPYTRRWYSNRGIPYRRGYMLHGPPGTGKSSLCFAAAGTMHLKIYLISLNSKTLTEDALATLFQSLPRRCIVLLEDVDAAGVANKRSNSTTPSTGTNSTSTEASASAEQKNTSTPAPESPSDGDKTENTDSSANQGVSLSALLNIIDGVASSEGRILVMTTNHIEKLDPALLRPGRVDMTVAFGYSDRETLKDLFLAIYAPLACEIKSTSAISRAAAVREQENGKLSLLKGHAGRRTPSTSSNISQTFSVQSSSEEEIRQMAEEFADRIPSGEFTPAEIQGFLLLHKKSPQNAIEEASMWVQQTRDNKAQQQTNGD
ncbi:putative BCS1-like ATPase [Talaromyces proteolyticus]|uniref:BCS1-like ATPase n=1 Tax=Talaromyces proteolyticus TaxID=1131652 RepID=A0AAD4PSU4_9EURO|nr:putative BCS1-like ATPase [Talaromyces proteolyticus]KAH8692066.1 putative BCS1-like ATPase [Talaromyces proteolyticus]